jgi:hypothetical protein
MRNNRKTSRALLIAISVTLPFLSSVCQTQNSASGMPGLHAIQTHSAATFQPNIFLVQLGKALNSRKLKNGDGVFAKVAIQWHGSEGTAAPRGSMAIGHIAQTTARTKGDTASKLGIVFDTVRHGGQDTPIKTVIVAVAPDPNLASDAAGGHVDYGDRTALVYNSSVPMQPGKPTPILNEQSRGVLGFNDLQLGPDGILVSSGGEVKLDSGTQILLAAQP